MIRREYGQVSLNQSSRGDQLLLLITVYHQSVVVYICALLFRKLLRATGRMSRKRSVRQGVYVYGWTILLCLLFCVICCLSSAMSLFDHLHDCYVECTQNYADKSFDKVRAALATHLETSCVHVFLLIQGLTAHGTYTPYKLHSSLTHTTPHTLLATPLTLLATPPTHIPLFTEVSKCRKSLTACSS